jgi:uncharacterized metal-binding protein YceD (DUF177 family)
MVVSIADCGGRMSSVQGDPKRGDPWRAYVTVTQIPDTGLHRDIEADEAARRAIAEVAGIREVLSAHASFDLRHKSGDQVHVTGRVRAKIGQTCVVTLDPIESEIDEEVDLIFAPSGQSLPQADLADDEDDDAAIEVDDQPEPMVDGVIDLGRLATDVLFLAIDPYPRKAGAVFEPLVAVADPEDHPFAALKALQADPAKQDGKKPRDK